MPTRASIRLIIDRLKALQNDQGYWSGKLSHSALSTATAISSLAVCLRERTSQPTAASNSSALWEQPARWIELIDAGTEYLVGAQNPDGGFGDTDRSHSNIATSLLVMAAWKLAGKEGELREPLAAAEKYVEQQGSWDGLRRRYGKDKTFVVPILSNCALAGMIAWEEVNPLPFEAAALPQSWYRFARMPVVSYAIPALVAIGQARFHHVPPKNLILRWMRKMALGRTRAVLRRMQPDSGGYLEATPLTSFVLMNLASIGMVDGEVARECRKFLVESVQADGSWPIDTNLATWVTSLAVSGILADNPTGALDEEVPNEDKPLVTPQTIAWLISCQHRIRHPFTGAEPGGWGWTDLSGAVPDADDTPSALIALHNWCIPEKIDEPHWKDWIDAAAMGVDWLIRLQNRDGGWPTFCRGWGTLPFDRSGSDLTAHAIRGLARWIDPPSLDIKFKLPDPRFNSSSMLLAIKRGLVYLARQQAANGSWLPLWFGNQDRENEENPIYGTGRVLLALGELSQGKGRETNAWKIDRSMVRRAIEFLCREQNEDGGWGGGASIRYDRNESVANAGNGTSTIEETSVAIEGLAACQPLIAELTLAGKTTNDELSEIFKQAVMRGVAWLEERIANDDGRVAQPIGFYFAKLWYYEEMYPYVFALAALQRASWAFPDLG